MNITIFTRIAAEKAKSLLKLKAKESPHVPPSVILNDFKTNVDTMVHPTLPSDKTMKRSIRRWRALPGMANPKTRDEISLTEEQDASGNRFLFRDSGGSERILIFATDNNLQVSLVCMIPNVIGYYTQIFIIY
jgi:hypothetical protein